MKEHLWTFPKVNGQTTSFVILQVVQDRSFFEYRIVEAKVCQLIHHHVMHLNELARSHSPHTSFAYPRRPRTPIVTWPRCAVLDDFVIIIARKYDALSSLLIIRLPNDIMGLWCYWSGDMLLHHGRTHFMCIGTVSSGLSDRKWLHLVKRYWPYSPHSHTRISLTTPQSFQSTTAYTWNIGKYLKILSTTNLFLCRLQCPPRNVWTQPN